jgi:hypothetical protein
MAPGLSIFLTVHVTKYILTFRFPNIFLLTSHSEAFLQVSKYLVFYGEMSTPFPPNLEDRTSVFMIPGDRLTRLYPQTCRSYSL